MDHYLGAYAALGLTGLMELVGLSVIYDTIKFICWINNTV